MGSHNVLLDDGSQPLVVDVLQQGVARLVLRFVQLQLLGELAVPVGPLCEAALEAGNVATVDSRHIHCSIRAKHCSPVLFAQLKQLDEIERLQESSSDSAEDRAFASSHDLQLHMAIETAPLLSLTLALELCLLCLLLNSRCFFLHDILAQRPRRQQISHLPLVLLQLQQSRIALVFVDLRVSEDFGVLVVPHKVYLLVLLA